MADNATTEAQLNTTVPATDAEVRSTTKSEEATETPRIEQRDGKLFVNGTRVYTRDDTNKIAASAKSEAISSVLRDLDVDSLEQVREVITTLKSSGEDGASTLDVKALKQAVAKREATVDELQKQVTSLRSELLLKDHVNNLNQAMPGSWSPEQRGAVLDLMKARDMFAIEGDTFQLRSGSEYLTQDGERPDYAAAIDIVARTLGLNTGKRGVDVVNMADNGTDSGRAKPIDENRLKTDAEYRAAYMSIRQYNPQLGRDQITHQQVSKHLDHMRKQRQTAR
jgi:hypothetical protein